jgi:hypothetical protein
MNSNNLTNSTTTPLPSHGDILGNIVAVNGSLDFNRFLTNDINSFTNDNPTKPNTDLYDVFAQSLMDLSQEYDDKSNLDSDTQEEFHTNRISKDNINKGKIPEWTRDTQDSTQESQEDTDDTMTDTSSKPAPNLDTTYLIPQGTSVATRWTALGTFATTNSHKNCSHSG